MLRFLPLLFLFVACANDPLDLQIVDTKAVSIDDGMISLPPDVGQWSLDHDDLTLRFSFRSDSADAGAVMLDGKYPLELPSLRLAGIEPDKPVKVSEGIWQDVEVQYIAATADNPAILMALYFNGNPIYYQQVLPDMKSEEGPLAYEAVIGNLKIKDARYSTVAGRTSSIAADGTVDLNLPILRYEYFHIPTGTRSFDDWDTAEPVKTGYINRVDLRGIADRRANYALRFTGVLNVPETETFHFSTWATGQTKLRIDGEIVNQQEGAPSNRTNAGNVTLSKGDHDFDLRIVQHVSWNAYNLSYRKTKSNEPARSLNTMEQKKAIATPRAQNPRELKTDDDPFLLRSFLYFPAPKLYEEATKRTHVISVGEGEGPHYSVDLQTGALLQAWRGEFADVHDMWNGRGEPQVMRPLGAAIQFSGDMLTADSATDPWPGPPEDPDEDDFAHLVHALDEAGRPVFEYDAGAGLITDHIVPNEGGLLREINHSAGGNSSQYVQLVAARTIEEVAPGEFALRSPGLKIRIESYDGSGLTLQRDGDLQRLIAELPAKGHVRYQIDW